MRSFIGMISPYAELSDLARAVAQERDEKLHLVEASGEESIRAAKQLQDMGAAAIITAGQNNTLLGNQLRIPVVPITLNGYSLMRTLMPLRNKFDKVALMQYKEINPWIEDISLDLDLAIKPLLFSNEFNAREAIAKALEEGFRVFVGGHLLRIIARDMGLKAYIFKYAKEDVLYAMEMARQMAALQQKIDSLNEVVNLAYEGIIVVDELGEIKLINSTAQKALGLSANKAMGRKISSLISFFAPEQVLRTGKAEINQFFQVGEAQMLFSCFPLSLGEQIEGAVISFHEVPRIEKLEAKIRREHSKSNYQEAKYRFQDIIGESLAIKSVIQQANAYALADEAVLITGETGTGKELFAQSMHNASRRGTEPFVAVNCAAIPSNLLESELFGYVEGAFTGANKGGKKGLIEAAHRGTIFLDEIGDMPYEAQTILLRVLQEKEVRPVGDYRAVPVDVRVIAATNVDLKEAIKEGKFRKDLFYRINILHIKIPPLRERIEDIPCLARSFIDTKRSSAVDLVTDVIGTTLPYLKSYYWPGNVRELETIVRRLSVMADHEVNVEQLSRDLLGEIVFGNSNELAELRAVSKSNVKELKKIAGETEREMIIREFMSSSGNRSDLAKKLGIGRTTLWRRLKEMGID